jgi:hypothetical protein
MRALSVGLALAAVLPTAACPGGGSIPDAGSVVARHSTSTIRTSSRGSSQATTGSTSSSGGTSTSTSAGGDGGCNCTDDGGAPFCDSSGRCLVCQQNSDCPVDAGTPYCNLDVGGPAYGQCVACATSADCGGGVCNPNLGFECDPSTQNCIDIGSCAPLTCDLPTGACVCNKDSDCSGNANGPFCNAASGACVQCRTAADCGLASAGCFLGKCGYCGFDGDCPPNLGCEFLLPGIGYCGCGIGYNGCGGNAPGCWNGSNGPSGTCGCESNGECQLACGTASVCSTGDGNTTGICWFTCTSDAQCDGGCNLDAGVCNAAPGSCG